jgi:hypothetical protein
MKQVALVLAVMVGLPGAAPAQQKAESVCQILGNLADFKGKIVTVRASIVYRAWLKADDECPVSIRVLDVKFPNEIATDWPDSRYVELLRVQVPFRTDEASRNLLFKGLGELHGINPKIYATVEGLIVTRDPPLKLAYPSRPDQPFGFGHLGMALALMVVKRVSDVELVRDRDDGSRERIPIKPAP